MKTINDLKNELRWMCYDHNKKPRNPKTLAFGGHTDTNNLVSYHDATATMITHNEIKGVGVVFYGDGLVGIDLDDCIDTVDGNEVIQPYAQFLITLAESYTERSPSGKGIHILGYGKLPKALTITKIDGTNVEAYENGRYFTFTEDMISNSDAIGNIQHVIDEIYSHVTGDTQKERQEVLKPESLAPQRVSYDHDNPPSSEYMRDLYERLIDRAVGMMDRATDGDRHHMRVRAGRLMGGIAQAFRDAGRHTHSDDALIDMIYHRCVPENNQRREWKSIEAGFIHGQKSPVRLEDYYPKRRTQQVVSTVAPKKRIINEETGEVMDNPTQEKEYFLTDAGNAERFADKYSDRLRWVADDEDWIEWTGTHWRRRVNSPTIYRYALDLTNDIHHSAVRNGMIDSAIGKWAKASQSGARIKEMVNLAKSYMSVTTSQFDNHPHLLNVLNGVVDLRTGQVKPHDKEYFFTKYIPIAYNPTANRDYWLNFLRTIFSNDDELISYMQRAVGYTLTGSTDEHCLFFCYGGGGNGKSTFIKALEMITSGQDESARESYNSVADIEALLDTQRNANQANMHVYNLYKTRLAILQEMPENRKMNESLVKSLTGGDRISARELYHGYITFAPTHKMWISGNYKPRVTGTDHGIWRRLKIVPFLAQISKDKIKPTSEIEREFFENRSSILSWAIDGAIEWYKNRLGGCQAVDNATAMYRKEEDTVERFIQDRCVVGGTYRANKQDLYDVWKEWAQDEGDMTAMRKSSKWLSTQLTARFNCTYAGSGNKYIVGIGIMKDDGTAEKAPIAFSVMRTPTEA